MRGDAKGGGLVATCAPPCASCKLPLATPIVLAEVERWDGPPNANLWCPSCGHGWVGSLEDLAVASASWREYEDESGEEVLTGDRGRTVLEALADSVPLEGEPKPVPVLPGQRGLFE